MSNLPYIYGSLRSCHIFSRSIIIPILGAQTPPNVGQNVKLDVFAANLEMPNQIGFKINLDKNKEKNHIRLSCCNKNMKYDFKNFNKFTLNSFRGYFSVK